MNAQTLSKAMGCSLSRAQQMVEGYNIAMKAANITTVNRAAMFAAQIGHESAGLVYMEERASGAAYEGRNDLGNTQSGDGRRYKGSGPIQLTGRSNFTAFSKWAASKGYIKDSDLFVRSPQLVRQNPTYGFLAASWYWTVARPNLNSQSDKGDVYAVTRSINGGLNGISDRLVRWRRCKALGSALLPSDAAPEEFKVTGKWSVEKVQKELGLKADGIYGEGTRKTVKAVQSALGQSADGLWGPATEEAYMELENKIDKMASDIKGARTDIRKAVTWSDREELTPATAKAIGWGERKNPSMTVGGQIMTTLRLAADAAAGVKRTESEMAQIADDVEALVKASDK